MSGMLMRFSSSRATGARFSVAPWFVKAEVPMKKSRLVLTTLGVAALCALVLVPLAAQSTPARTFTPVTDEMLRNPSPGDWVNWRRTLDGWGYSPLEPDQPAERRPAPARVVVGDAAGIQSADAARLQRHHVSPQPEQHRAGAGRGHRRSDLGVSPGVSDGAGQSQPGGDGVGRPQRSLAI